MKFLFEKSQAMKSLFSQQQLDCIKDWNQQAASFKGALKSSQKSEQTTSFKEQENRWKTENIGMANVRKF